MQIELTCEKALSPLCIRSPRSPPPNYLLMPSPSGIQNQIPQVVATNTGLYRINLTGRLYRTTQKVRTIRIDWSEPVLDIPQADRPWRRSCGRTPLPAKMLPIALKTRSNINLEINVKMPINIRSAALRITSSRFPSFERRHQPESQMSGKE